MGVLKPKDIRKMTPAERKKKLTELYAELARTRIQVSTGGGSENPYQIRNIKRSIARLLTIMHENNE